MSDVYQTHHERMFAVLSKKNEDPAIIAKDIVVGELKRGKVPKDVESFENAIRDGIMTAKSGKIMSTLGIDFPHTCLETDPVCRACRDCSSSMDKKQVFSLLENRKQR